MSEQLSFGDIPAELEVVDIALKVEPALEVEPHDPDLCTGLESDMSEMYLNFLRCRGCGRVWSRPSTSPPLQRKAFDR